MSELWDANRDDAKPLGREEALAGEGRRAINGRDGDIEPRSRYFLCVLGGVLALLLGGLGLAIKAWGPAESNARFRDHGPALREWALSRRGRLVEGSVDATAAQKAELSDLGWPGVAYMESGPDGLALYLTNVGALGHDRGVLVVWSGQRPSDPGFRPGLSEFEETPAEGVYRIYGP